MLQNSLPHDARKRASAWLPEKWDRSDESAQIFCFSYAGGSAEIYRQWQKQLTGCARIIPVELPGRGTRHGEPFCPSIPQAAAAAALAISAGLSGQTYFLFGHSLGSALALETARKLEDMGISKPAALVVSGRFPPHAAKHKRRLHTASDDELLAELRRLGGTPEDILRDNDFVRFILPIIRDDFRLIETHAASALPQVAVPIHVCCGRDDIDSPVALLERWAEVTTAGMDLTLFDGGHFYINTQKDDVISHLKTLAGRYDN